MRKRNAWIIVCLINLAVVALLGFTLRTKFLYPIPFLDYRNLISTHSHFAFGGWVTLALMVLFIEQCLPIERRMQKSYQVILWGILLTSYGMLFSFPFKGYTPVSIVFSTLFIFFTYAFAWNFSRHILRHDIARPVKLLAVTAMACLVVSSVGPFRLAYIMSSPSGTASQMRDAVYTYLHFQYNGFFTLSVFALLFSRKIPALQPATIRRIHHFAIALCLSIIPTLFLSLLWHHYYLWLRIMSLLGAGLIIITLILFFRIPFQKERLFKCDSRIATFLLALSMISFVTKMALQTGTIFPDLGNAVFGYRPIIIGFLHLVFLGLVTFFILSSFLDKGLLNVNLAFTRFAVGFFATMVILNELVLLVDGLGRLFKTTNPIYDRLLWFIAMGLFTGAVMMVVGKLRSRERGSL